MRRTVNGGAGGYPPVLYLLRISAEIGSDYATGLRQKASGGDGGAGWAGTLQALCHVLLVRPETSWRVWRRPRKQALRSVGLVLEWPRSEVLIDELAALHAEAGAVDVQATKGLGPLCEFQRQGSIVGR